MNGDDFAALIQRDLEPLLAATSSVGLKTVNHRSKGGRVAPGNKMWVSVPGSDNEVTLTRSLTLSTWEAALLKPYGEALADLDGIPDAVARNAVDDVALRAIAVQLGGDHAVIVEAALRFLFRCAVDTYEGQPVHLNLLVDFAPVDTPAPISTLESYRTHDWHALLGSGLETGVLIDRTGGVQRIDDLRGLTYDPAPAANALRPDAFRLVGDWTRLPDRVALSLARSGEVLIHQNGQLRYVHRAGAWRGLPAIPARKAGWSHGASYSAEVKDAVLASVIDASLAHHGASLAVVARGQKSAFLADTMIQDSDLWPQNVRSKLFRSHSFGDLTRRQRLELLSMDGATVIDHRGQILTSGAIVSVPAGSDGGGRLAATKALARFGAAFKVSQDGPIQLFGRDALGAAQLRLKLA